MIEKQCQERTLMNFVLPTIDGILTYNKKYVLALKTILNDQPSDKNIITLLNKFLYLDNYEVFVYDSVAKILSILLSELDSKTYQRTQIQFLEHLMTLQQNNHSNSQPRITDQTIYNCLIYLLKNGKVACQFINNKGVEILANGLDKYSSQLQTVYHLLMDCWLISYEEKSYPYFRDPLYGLIKLITNTIQRLSREKIIRISFSIFRVTNLY